MKQSEYQKLFELEDSHWWFVGRRQLVAALVERWISPEKLGAILDIGCGTGGNLSFLSRWGCETGLDLSPLALGFARRRHLPRLTQASGLALPYANERFGLVTAFDVLYHRWVTQDDQVLRECYRVLQPGGWLLVMEVALPSLWSPHDEIFYSRQRYTTREMARLVKEAGFSLRKLSYANSLLLPMMAAVRWMERWFAWLGDAEMRPAPGWLNRVLTSLLSLEARWLREATFPLGSSLVCLAQKPTDVNTLLDA